MFKENINHLLQFLIDETMFREKKKKELSFLNKKRNYFMFSLAYLFIFLLIMKILNVF